MPYSEEHNHIVLETRTPNSNEFIVSPMAGIQDEAVRDMFAFIEQHSNLRIEKIRSYQLPKSHLGERMLGFRIVKIKEDK